MRSRKKMKSFWKQMKRNSQQSKNYGSNAGSPESETPSNTGLPKKDRNIQINNLTLHLQELEEQQQTKPRASRRMEMVKIRTELNDIETKRVIQKINKSRSLFFDKINKINTPLP